MEAGLVVADDNFFAGVLIDLSKKPRLAGHQIEEPDCDDRSENEDVARHHNGSRGPNQNYGSRTGRYAKGS